MIFLLVFSTSCEHRQGAHERLEDFDPDELSAQVGGSSSGVVAGGEPLPSPASGPLREGQEHALEAVPGEGRGTEQAGRRSNMFRPDRVTDLVGQLGYYEVFSPAIAPFKRMTALDAVSLVDGVPVLGVAHPARSPVPVGGVEAPPDPDRDRFWGSVVLDFSHGNVLPLPSVAPEARILSARADPDIELRIERDGADNFFVVAPAAPTTQVRLTFVTDAPRAYFGGPLPESSSSLAHEAFPLPPAVAADVARLAAHLGILDLEGGAARLAALTRHFRSFEESKDPPRDSGNIFLDLASQRRGVCRHRAYAFVILALGLGIPARFVQNEAHAWVEAKLAEVGWMRIDLGGAPHGIDTRASGDRPRYQSGVSDPWPRPPEYEAAYAEAALEAQRDGQAQSEEQSSSEPRAPGDMRLKPTLARGRGDGVLRDVHDRRAPLSLRVTRHPLEVMRGRPLNIEGVATDTDGVPLAGLRIEVSLASPDEDRATLLGVSVTGEDGRFVGAFSVPPELAPGDYALVVVTPGDAQHRAARAD